MSTMADLAALLDRTTPEDLPPLERCDLVDLARRARRRARLQRVAVSTAGLLVVTALAFAAVTAIAGPGEPGADVKATWAGPGGEPLEEPVGRWAQAEDPPFSARHSAFGGTLSDGRVLVWGGYEKNANAMDGGIYDPSTGEWEYISPAPFESEIEYGTFQQQVQLADDRLAIVSTDVLRRPVGEASAAVYDVERGEWVTSPRVELADDPIDFAPVVWDGETLALLPRAVGLETYSEPVTWRWTIGDETWQRGAPAPIGLRTGVGTAFDGRRLAMWSGSINGRLQSDGAIYDVPTDSWEILPAAPVSGGEYPLVVWFDGRVMVSPSTMNAPVPEEQLEDVGDLAAYDPVTGRWERIPRSPDFMALDGYPYVTRDGMAHVPPNWRLTEPAAGVTRYLVFTKSLDRGGEAEEPWFLESREWERAPFAGLFGLGAFTVAVSGLDSISFCCPDPPELDVQVRVAPDEWLEAVSAPFPPRRYETIVATGDKLVVIGGSVPDEDGGTEETAGDAWVFDLAG
jgi:hypothetical protein